jgi:hypothetical protein
MVWLVYRIRSMWAHCRDNLRTIVLLVESHYHKAGWLTRTFPIHSDKFIVWCLYVDVAVVMVPLFDHVDGKDRAVGDSGVSGASAMVALMSHSAASKIQERRRNFLWTKAQRSGTNDIEARGGLCRQRKELAGPEKTWSR